MSTGATTTMQQKWCSLRYTDPHVDMVSEPLWPHYRHHYHLLPSKTVDDTHWRSRCDHRFKPSFTGSLSSAIANWPAINRPNPHTGNSILFFAFIFSPFILIKITQANILFKQANSMLFYVFSHTRFTEFTPDTTKLNTTKRHA